VNSAIKQKAQLFSESSLLICSHVLNFRMVSANVENKEGLIWKMLNY